MNITNWLAQVYLSEHFIRTALVFVVFSTAMGHFLDRIMGRSSFGVTANVIVVFFAVAAAASVNNRRIFMLMPDDTMRISTVAVIIGCSILILFATMRQIVRDHA